MIWKNDKKKEKKDSPVPVEKQGKTPPQKGTSQLMQIFLCTFKIGAFTFGGGYAMIPIMEEEFVTKRKWIDEKEMVDILAVVQAAPGIIAVNSSIFLGYKIAGLAGAFSAVLGIALPSFLIIAVLSGFYLQFQSKPLVLAALSGIRAGVVALILSAVLKLGKRSVTDLFCWCIAIAGFLAVVVWNVSPLPVIVVAGFIGWLRFKFKKGVA